jgi:2,4'-dihydroxyacetophenone dioxygenase
LEADAMDHEHPLLRATAHLPWADLSPGFQLKLLHGEADDDTRALLLRLQPGTVVGRHRHSGEVHAINLAGRRELIDTGEIVGPGGYVHEPAGNVDSWRAVGDEPCVVFVTVRGAIDALGDDGRVLRRTTTGSIAADYSRVLAAHVR